MKIASLFWILVMQFTEWYSCEFPYPVLLLFFPVEKLQKKTLLEKIVTAFIKILKRKGAADY